MWNIKNADIWARLQFLQWRANNVKSFNHDRIHVGNVLYLSIFRFPESYTHKSYNINICPLYTLHFWWYRDTKQQGTICNFSTIMLMSNACFFVEWITRCGILHTESYDTCPPPHFLLIWFDFNPPTWLRNHTHWNVWAGITYPFLNYKELIINFIPHFTTNMINYPCGD